MELPINPINNNNNNNRNLLLSCLDSLRQLSQNLQSNPFFQTSSPQSVLDFIAKLEQDQKHNLLSPPLSNLSQLLSTLKTHLHRLQKHQDHTFKSILHRPFINYKIYQLGFAIEAEIRAYLDRDYVQCLVKTLRESDSEEEKVGVLIDFEKRVLEGFDRDFQEIILKAKVFSVLDFLLCDSTCSRRVRDHAARGILSLVKFNKDVFVGLVLMGQIIQALISMASSCCIKVLCSLIALIRTPLIDEIELDGEIPRIVSLINSQKLSLCIAAIDCVCEIAYHGRKEVIEAMIEQGLIEKLVELQRSVYRVSLIQTEQLRNCEIGEAGRIEEVVDVFSRCIARFAVQIEIGEGLGQKEKKEFKGEILKRVREASVSEAEAASIIAEVLWGLSP